ncbi:hypothetical protein CCACVL1_00552, partial [Corchorus capsularis]
RVKNAERLTRGRREEANNQKRDSCLKAVQQKRKGTHKVN